MDFFFFLAGDQKWSVVELMSGDSFWTLTAVHHYFNGNSLRIDFFVRFIVANDIN